MKRREVGRSIGIAARARQWLLDERSHALQQARVAEDHAHATHRAASLALSTAQSESRQLLSKLDLRAVDLRCRSSFEWALLSRIRQAQSSAEKAQADVDAIRAEMHGVLLQRNAYRQRLTRLRADASVQWQQIETKASDELWSSVAHRSGAPSHED